MHEDTVVSFSHPDRVSIEDPLTAVLRSGARRLLAEAVEAEVEAFIAAHVDLSDEAGRRRVVRHGYLPEREVQTGIGAVAVRRPRVRDRQADAGDGRIRFTSSTLPPYLRRAKSVEELLPADHPTHGGGRRHPTRLEPNAGPYPGRLRASRHHLHRRR